MTFKHRTSPSGRKGSEKRTVTVPGGSLDAKSTLDTTASLSGLSTTDVVTVNTTTELYDNLSIVGARCSAAGVLQVRFLNPNPGLIELASTELLVAISKFGA